MTPMTKMTPMTPGALLCLLDATAQVLVESWADNCDDGDVRWATVALAEVITALHRRDTGAAAHAAGGVRGLVDQARRGDR
jgi:hypothetical protein